MKRPVPTAGSQESPAKAKPSRSGDLLRKAIQRQELTLDDVATCLCLQRAAVDELLDGSKVMSLPHQLCFAGLLLDRVPSLARPARTLKAQVLAAIAFNEHQTKVHSQPPPDRWRPLKLL